MIQLHNAMEEIEMETIKLIYEPAGAPFANIV